MSLRLNVHSCMFQEKQKLAAKMLKSRMNDVYRYIIHLLRVLYD